MKCLNPLPPTLSRGQSRVRRLAGKRSSQEDLARDDERQSLANLRVPHGQTRNRRSTDSIDAMREQSQPRKHGIRPAIDFDKHEIIIEPGGGRDGDEFEDVSVALTRTKLEQIERSQTESEPSNGPFCTVADQYSAFLT